MLCMENIHACDRVLILKDCILVLLHFTLQVISSTRDNSLFSLIFRILSNKCEFITGNIDNIFLKNRIESRNLVCAFVVFLGGGDYCCSRHCVNTGYRRNAELFFYFKHSPSKGQHSHQNNIRESHYLLTRSHFQICHGMIEQNKNKSKPRRRHFFLVRV